MINQYSLVALIFSISVLLLYFALILRSNFLVYLYSRPWTIRLSSNHRVFVIISLVLIVLIIIFGNYNPIQIMYSWGIPFSVYLFIAYLLLYGKNNARIINIDQARIRYTNFIKKAPELLVIHLNSHPLNNNSSDPVHIIPTHLLLSNELIVDIDPLDINMQEGDEDQYALSYSLTYCLLCNTSHAYLLPIINNKPQEISSNRAMIMRGNKILATDNGKYIWQQFTGKGLNKHSKEITLHELTITKLHWKHVHQVYPHAKYLYVSKKPVAHIVFSQIQKLVKNISFLVFTQPGKNHQLANKELVLGINLLGEGIKAYPMQLFHLGKPVLIEDRIGSMDISIVSDGYNVKVFKVVGLKLENNQLLKDDHVWDLYGKSDKQDLETVFFSENVYWYIWNKFNPKTEIFTQSTK